MPIPAYVAALRRLGGHAELWLPGATAVIRRGEQILLVRRSDNGAWTPVTGIVEPGEDPAATARREALEEAGVTVRVDRLALVSVTRPVTHANGDRAVYLDHAFACTWLAGEPYPADDESTAAGWFDPGSLPPMKPEILARIEAACADEVATRFRS